MTHQRAEAAVWAGLGAAAAAAAALLLWLGRDSTFTIDELVFFSESPLLTLESALEPHNGHLILSAKLVYAAMLEVFGADYAAFRALGAVTVLLTAVLVFAFASRRVGHLAALAPTLVLFVFGADSVHLLRGNGFLDGVGIASGVAALLALDRGDRRGDAYACALLCLGVVSFSVALAFVAGVAVRILVGDDRFRRIWVALVPLVLYTAWFAWSVTRVGSAEGQLEISNLLLFPAWSYQALSAVLGALTGLDYDFTAPGSLSARAGPVLALAALAALAWRLRQPARVPAALWGALATALALWALQAVVYIEGIRAPGDGRYLLPGAVVVLVVAAEAGRSIRWSRGGLVALYAVAGVGIATNIALLADLDDDRAQTADVRSAFTGIELAGEHADPEFNPEADPDPQSPVRTSLVRFPFRSVAAHGNPPTATYLSAAERYGSLGYPLDELRELAEPERARADAFLAGALGLELEAVETSTGASRCRKVGPEPGEPIVARLPEGGAVLSADAAAGPVEVRRFADEEGVPVGTLTPGARAVLEIPSDGAPEPWRASMPGASLSVCPLR